MLLFTSFLYFTDRIHDNILSVNHFFSKQQLENPNPERISKSLKIIKSDEGKDPEFDFENTYSDKKISRKQSIFGVESPLKSGDEADSSSMGFENSLGAKMNPLNIGLDTDNTL